MEQADRQEHILAVLRADGKVDVESLARTFNVTAQTVRRDLGELCDRGLATRTHGGAKRLVSASSYGYEERRASHRREKESLGLAVAELIPDNCSITLNIGTTTEQVARALTAHKDLVVVSNNINVIHVLMASPAKDLILVGGSVRRDDGAIVGQDAVEFLSRYKTDYAIIGTSSMDSDGAIMDFDAREVAVARAILKNARTRILVADVSKFERSAPVRICDVSELDYVFTDKAPPGAFLEAAARGDTRVVYPGGPDV